MENTTELARAFEHCVRLEAAQRESFLASLRDSSLVARLRPLLEAHERAERTGFLLVHSR
jgi:hypothetical protein